MSEPSPHQITEAQYRAALVALGLDPDRVMSINLSPRWVMVTLVKLEDGLPVVSLGEVETEMRIDGQFFCCQREQFEQAGAIAREWQCDETAGGPHDEVGERHTSGIDRTGQRCDDGRNGAAEIGAEDQHDY